MIQWMTGPNLAAVVNGDRFEELMIQRFCPSSVRRARAAVLSLATFSLLGCSAAPSSTDPVERGSLLHNNLSVAAAALAAGQPEVARRQYLALSERFRESPEPFLGLAHVAFGSGNHARAERHFLKAATLARDAPALRAEALLGAGRTALARGEIRPARRHLARAHDLGRDLPLAPWIANAAAVAAAMDDDYDMAESDLREALRLSSGHPVIAANLVRMLVAAGRRDEAARLFARHEPSYWPDDDARVLSRLIERPAGGLRSPAWVRNAAPGLVLRVSDVVGHATPAERAGLQPSSGLALRLATRTGGARPETARHVAAQPALAKRRRAPHSASSDELTVSLGESVRLDLTGDAASVLVASPKVADVQLLSPKVLYVIGKSIGRTVVTVVGADGWIQDRNVSVGLDLVPVRSMLASDPELKGLEARHFSTGVALTGEVASAALALRAVHLVTASLPSGTLVDNGIRVVGAQQVNLEVQIAEVQRSVAEDLGINWDVFGVSNGNALRFQIGRDLEPENGAIPLANVGGQGSPGLYFGRQTAKISIRSMIDALAQAGLANVLARPNVTAVSGESASFFSGGEYPLPTGFDDGVLIFEYKKFGVLLDFVPTVIDSGRISLHVRPEVSEPSVNQSVQVAGTTIPVINVRRAETTVEIGNGESIVIAGLFRNSSDTREAGVPFLKDLPGFGTLFAHRSVRSEELELVVIVTARLVQPGRPAEQAPAPARRRAEGYHF